MRIAAAAALYFLICFGTGLLLGPIRVLLLEPRLGMVIASLCEAPLMLAAIVIAARRVPRMTGLQPRSGAMLTVGLGGLALLLACELAVGKLLRGLDARQQLDRLATTEGLIYAALLAAFALMPAIVNRYRT